MKTAYFLMLEFEFSGIFVEIFLDIYQGFFSQNRRIYVSLNDISQTKYYYFIINEFIYTQIFLFTLHSVKFFTMLLL